MSKKRARQRWVSAAEWVAMIGAVATIISAMFASPWIAQLISRTPVPTITPTQTPPPPTFTSSPAPSATNPPTATFTITPSPTLTPTSTSFPPPLDPTLVTPPPGGMPPRALVYEAEDMGSFAETPLRAHAYGKKAVLLNTGDQITFIVYIEQEGWYTLYIRHSNDNLNEPAETEKLNVTIDGAKRGQFRTEDTGDGGRGWDIFKEPPFGDLYLTPGTHYIELVITGGDNFGINIDAVILVRRE